MMKSSYVLFLVIFVALLPGLAFSQASMTPFPQTLEFNSIGGGARAAGMGGAFLGISEGEYAYGWNPAGMIFAQKPSIGLQFNSNKDKFSKGYIFLSSNSGQLGADQANANRSIFNLGNSGVVVPFSFYEKQWAVGGGFHNVQTLDLNYETPGFQNSKNSYAQKEGIDAVTVSVSGKLTENIGIGVAANDYVRGGESNSYTGRYWIIPKPGSTTIDTVDAWVNSQSHYSGINFDIGLAAEYSIFKGGVVAHTPYNLKQEVLRTDYIMYPPTPQGFVNRYTSTIDIPFSYSLGLSAKPMNNLVLDFDFDVKPLSKSEQKIDWEMLQMPDTTISLQWKNLNQFRVGAEYTFKIGFASVPLRVGFRNNPSPYKQIKAINEAANDTMLTAQVIYGDQITTNIISFGSGLHFERAWIDLAYQFGKNSFTYDFNYLVPQTLKLTEKRDYSRLFVSAGMNF